VFSEKCGPDGAWLTQYQLVSVKKKYEIFYFFDEIHVEFCSILVPVGNLKCDSSEGGATTICRVEAGMVYRLFF